MKFVKGKKAESAKPLVRPVQLAGKAPKPSPNPWIGRHLFDLMEQRAVAAENMCRNLIAVIAVDDGEFLAGHDYDYLVAGNAILKGEI